MRKNIYLLLILIIILLPGCSKKAPMTSFIPTLAPSGDDQIISEDSGPQSEDEGNGSNLGDSGQQDAQATLSPKPIVIGQTTSMYVKLDEYGDYLNVRPTSSTQGAPVGFLVHAEQIDVIDIVDGWASFEYKGAICYVNADFLVEERPAYLEPPTPTPKPAATPTPVPGEAPPEI